MDVTKDFQTFVDSIFDMDYHEIYELYQAASGNEGSISLYRVETANGSDDTLIIHEASNNALRLTPKAKEFFPKWIEANLILVFFKAPDAEAFQSAFREYSASLLNKDKRPSVLAKLHELVQAAAELPGKVRHKEQERGL